MPDLAYRDLRFPRLGQMRGGVGVEGPITGTGPTLAALQDGDTLGDKVTWGSVTPVEATVEYLMSSDFGVTWLPYDADTEVSGGQTWVLQKVATLGDVTRRFYSSVVVVTELPVVPVISGPLPTIQPLIAGQILAEVVVWPLLTTNVGTLNDPVRSMRINGGAPQAYNPAFAPAAGSTVEIQQITTSTAGATRTDTAGPVDVIAPQGWVLNFGDAQITIVQMPPVQSPIIFAGDGQIIIQEYA